MQNQINSIKSTTNTLVFIFTVITIVLNSTGCAPAERSAEKALGNAGSVIQSGADKLWIEDPQATPIPNP